MYFDSFHFCKNIVATFNNGTIDEKKSLLIRLNRNMILKDKIINIEPKIPYMNIKHINSELVEGYFSISPEQIPLEEAKGCINGVLEKVSLGWYQRRESNPHYIAVM